VQVVSERRKPRHDAATHDPEGEEGDRHGTPLPPDQAIGVGWQKRQTSIQLGRLTFRRTVYLSAITTMVIGRPKTVTWFASRKPSRTTFDSNDN
jgi:hypothetical protein